MSPHEVADNNVITKGTLLFPPAAGETLVDNGDERRSFRIAFLDAASGQEGDSHRLEVAFADSSDFHCANAVVGVVMTRELGRHIPLAVERHDVDQSCGTYSGKRLNASEQLLLQGPALFL